MVTIKVPAEISRPVAEKATRYAREEALRRGWSIRSASSLTPLVADGVIGITTDIKHLFYQERGTRPFLMKSLEGRRIPLDGRVITVKDVGKPGFVRIPREVGPDKVVWREQKWRHPGIKPTNIMKNSLSRALLEEKQNVKEEILRRLMP